MHLTDLLTCHCALPGHACNVQERLTGAQVHSREVLSLQGEGDIADVVREVANKHARVHVGSYINNERRGSEDYSVKVVVQGCDNQAVEDAVAELQDALQKQS